MDPTLELRDPAFLEHVVRHNIELKCRLMAVDPQEKAEGMVLQYGHTVGHPIEHLSGYALTHGEAVAVGMVIAARVAHLMGALDADGVQRHLDVIRRWGLPTQVPADVRTADILKALTYNKTWRTEGTRMALVDGPGRLWRVSGAYAIPVSETLIATAVDQTRGETHERSTSDRRDHRRGQRHRTGVRGAVRRPGAASTRPGPARRTPQTPGG
jgi:3-dehydroquinate synthetase